MAEHKSLEVSPLAPGIIPVDEWKPEPEDIVVKFAGKTIWIPFNEIFEGAKNIDPEINIFYASHKDSYVKKFNEITHYINYFIKFYDKDNELIMNYLHMKYMIDIKSTNPKRNAIIGLLYKDFITPSMYAKVKHFVEDNYCIDLAQNKESGKEYSESLEFTNRHAKLLMMISIFIKMLIPVVMHYINMIAGKAEVKKLIMYYKPLFELVNKLENVNLYAKLFHSIMTKVQFNEQNNPVIWGKYAVNSTDAVYYAEELLDKNLIVDNIFKYVFNKSIIAFNSVILSTQLDYRCIKNFGINLREISTEKDSDGLSYLDKLEMNMVKIDESIILLSKVNIKDTIKRIRKKNRVNIPKEELEFYLENTKINKLSKALVFYYYSKDFGGFVDLNHINIKAYMELMLIMKRRLAYNGYYLLSQILSANIDGKINNRIIHNTKYNDNIRNSSVFQNLMDEKYSTLKSIGKEDVIINLLSTIINTQFRIVDYNDPSKLGELIEVNYDTISQEFLDFVNSI